jgi:hypothetical protein
MEHEEFIEGLVPETPESILESGFRSAFDARFGDGNQYYPDGVPNINDSDFFEYFYENYVLQNYKECNKKWRIRILDALKHFSQQPHSVVTYQWEGKLPPFDLHKDQYQEFLMNIHDRLNALNLNELR